MYKLKKNLISTVHKAMYNILKERFGLHPKLAIDCYRDAISIYKSWLSNPKRGRYPIIKQYSIWLTPKLSYRINLEEMKVWIRDAVSYQLLAIQEFILLQGLADKRG